MSGDGTVGRTLAVALGGLLVANGASILASPLLMTSKAGAICTLVVVLAASFAAAFHVARHSPWGGYWLGVSMLVPATAAWVFANFIYTLNGVGTDFGTAKGHVIVGIFSAGVNLVACVVGADFGADFNRGSRAELFGRPRPTLHVGWWLGAVVGLVLLFVFGVGLAWHWGQAKAEIYLVPDGCVGWVAVDFGVPGAPRLPMEDGFGVVEVPPSGRVQTSNEMVVSPRIAQHWYVRDGKRVAEAPSMGGGAHGAPGAAGITIYTTYLFIGTREEMELIGKGRDDHGRPVPGLSRCK